MKKYLIFLIILFSASSCTKNKNPLYPLSSSDFSIYLLKDSTMTYDKACKTQLNKLEIQDRPWLSEVDIAMYDFSSHYIYLKGDRKTFFNNTPNGCNLFSSVFHKPFILIAGQQRIYLGGFVNSFSSVSMPTPCIIDLCLFTTPTDIIPIDGYYADAQQDLRNDIRIQGALKNMNLYHAGLEIILNSVQMVDNSDTSTIKYSFTITNHDQNILLVPDPDLMGSDMFHYYTNGIYFSGENNSFGSYYKNTSGPMPFDSWDSSWFVELKGNTTIDRMVYLRGYQKIPKGQYYCNFEYSGPKNIEKSERMDHNRRYWIGRVKSNTISMSVN